jgi:SpoVK/Ycf46/Vps4 family AAA+-type ATPase
LATFCAFTGRNPFDELQPPVYLTTNRPDQLEAALTSRPGRIDQAIEFPLPDEDGRRKLIQLYSGGLKLDEEVVALLIQKGWKAFWRRSAIVFSANGDIAQRHYYQNRA